MGTVADYADVHDQSDLDMETHSRKEASEGVSLSEARAQFTSLVNYAADVGKRTIITKFNRPVAAIVPVSDLARLEQADAAAREQFMVTAVDSELVEIERDDTVKFGENIHANKSEISALVRALMDDPDIYRLVMGVNTSHERESTKNTVNDDEAPRAIS